MKVLLLTHNPICTGNNMGKTFLSLFSEFWREQLCQLYIHSEIPDIDVCNSYFQITDKMVLKSLVFGTPGKEIPEEMIAERVEKRNKGEFFVPSVWKGANSLKCLARDLMWKSSRWYSSELRAWLDRESPTVIFLAPGYAKFIYDIALKIADERKLPIVTYVCDDYYFVKTPETYFGKKHLFLLQKKTDELMKMTDCLVAISEEIAQNYTSHFGVKSEVIMTGADVCASRLPIEKSEIHNFSYFGNLSLGRNISLAEIGKTIDHLNSIHGTDIVFRIYTGENNEEVLSVFSGIRCVKFCGFVSGEAFKDTFCSSDILIHAESFAESDIEKVKHSISTKIADSLSSEIPLIAYGPEQISSIQHLIRNQCAIVATSNDMLKTALEDAILNKDKRIFVCRNAKNVANKYHNKAKNSTMLMSVLLKAEEEYDRSPKKRT